MTARSRYVSSSLKLPCFVKGGSMIGIPLGFLYANATEWVAHRFVLHGWGKRKESFWNFHWGEHHRHVRKNGHRDETYLKPLLSAWNPKSKETVALTFGVAAHLPLAPIAPFFVGTVAYSAIRYYRLHRRSHLDPQILIQSYFCHPQKNQLPQH